jgi:hypothetical protein
METFFRMRKSHISSVIKTFLDALFIVAEAYLGKPSMFHDRMPLYDELVREKCGGAITHVWGFIDGTLRKICRPMYNQRVAYSGHKRCHGVKFQSVVTPDGYIALMYGPIEGSRHDSTMLAESQLLNTLQILMPGDDGLPIYKLYGDPAYSISLYLCKAIPNAAPGSEEAQWNKEMSSVRQIVEWGFKEIVAQWKFLNNKEEMKVFKIPVAHFYICAAFLTNLRNCYYGGQISQYFCDDIRLTIHEYMALVD